MPDVSYRMNDRVAVVTGAATGIGKATAAAFAAAGATVYLLDIDPRAGAEAADGVGEFIHTDVTSSESVNEAIQRVGDHHGRLDCLVNNAGGFGTQQTSETLDLDEWRALIELNLTSVFLVTRAAIPLLRRSGAGRVVNLGSLAGQTAGYRTSPAYAAAKGGVHALTRVLAHELAPDGITVNAVAPSAVLTERIVELRDEDERAATARSIPLGRYQTPDELASWVVYLASQEAGFMTGETVAVNGGRFMV